MKTLRFCRSCNKSEKETKFYADINQRDCKECRRKINRERNLKHIYTSSKTWSDKKIKKWNKKNPFKINKLIAFYYLQEIKNRYYWEMVS